MYRNEGRPKVLDWYHLMIFCEFFVFVVINYAKLEEILFILAEKNRATLENQCSLKKFGPNP